MKRPLFIALVLAVLFIEPCASQSPREPSRIGNESRLGKEITLTTTITVLDSTAPAARLALAGKRLHNGRPIMDFDVSDIRNNFSVTVNAYVVLHIPSNSHVKVVDPSVMDFPPGRYVYPNGVGALLVPKKPGTTKVLIQYSGSAEVCNVVAQCSPNWSGYVITPGTSQPFSGITGRWTVPLVASNSPSGTSSTWVGLDGWNNNTVLQAGTEQDFNPWYSVLLQPGGVYYVWYETWPDPQTLISLTNPSDIVSPGDKIAVSITPVPAANPPTANAEGDWLIVINDETKNWKFNTTTSYSGNLSSAEWIEEATSGLSGIQTMADYGSVMFQGAPLLPFHNAVSLASAPLGAPGFVSSQEVSLNQNGPNGIFSTPSSPSGDQTTFTVSWSEFEPYYSFPPGPWISTTLLPPALLGQTYTQTLSVSAASNPHWSSFGVLPSGITLQQNGILMGVPSSLGNFSFSVSATDLTTGATTSKVPLVLTVTKQPESILQLTCEPVAGVPSASVALEIDGRNVSCNASLTLPLGRHVITGVVSGAGPSAYTLLFGGSCNSSGIFSLSEGQVATCVVAAQATSLVQSAGCASGFKCVYATAKGCKRCIPIDENNP